MLVKTWCVILKCSCQRWKTFSQTAYNWLFWYCFQNFIIFRICRVNKGDQTVHQSKQVKQKETEVVWQASCFLLTNTQWASSRSHWRDERVCKWHENTPLNKAIENKKNHHNHIHEQHPHSAQCDLTPHRQDTAQYCIRIIQCHQHIEKSKIWEGNRQKCRTSGYTCEPSLVLHHSVRLGGVRHTHRHA